MKLNMPPEIVNCSFAFLCNRVWDDLAPIEGFSDVRYCCKCSKSVHMISQEDFWERAEAGHCVALIKDDDISHSGRGALVGLIERAEER